MKSKLLAAVAVGGLLLAAISLAEAQSDTEAQPSNGAAQSQAPANGAESSDPVVAVVNGQELHRSDVLESAGNLPPAYQQNIDRIFPALVDRLVDLTLLTQAGREKDLQNDETVREMVANFEDEAIRQVLLQRYLTENLTDEKVKEQYQNLVDEFEPQPEIRARHILVKTKEEAEAIIKELEGGADFAEMAKKKSTGPSAPQGGDLGYFTADQMVPEFADAAFALKKGEFTKEPVKTQFGWHVIKVEDKRQKQPPAFEDVKAQVRQILLSEKYIETIGNLRKAAKVEVKDPTLKKSVDAIDNPPADDSQAGDKADQAAPAADDKAPAAEGGESKE